MSDAAATRPPLPGPADRESFLDQQARYRRQTWRLTALCAVAVLLMGVPLSVIVSPLVWSVVVLGADVLKLVAPSAPNLGATAFAALDRVLGTPARPSYPELVRVTLWSVLPGIAAMLVVWLGVREWLLRSGPNGILAALNAREPRPGDFEEHQLVDVVSEIAVAAGVPAPRVMLLDAAPARAGAIGSAMEDAVLLVSSGLLVRLDREETQAVIADVVASIGHGDLHMALIILSLVQTLGLVSTLLGAPFGPRARATLGRLLRLVRRHRAGDDQADAYEIRQLLEQSFEGENDEPEVQGTGGRTRLRDVLQLPFVVAQAAFWMNQMVFVWLLLGPLIALTWRARRYRSDAAAVQLTRDPTAVARGLAKLSAEKSVAPKVWASHLFIAGQGSSDDRPLPSLVSFSAPLDQRLKHLRAAGAAGVDLPRSTGPNAFVIALLSPLLVLVVAVMFGVALALVGIALCIDMLFLLPVVGGLHALLRWWIGG